MFVLFQVGVPPRKHPHIVLHILVVGAHRLPALVIDLSRGRALLLRLHKSEISPLNRQYHRTVAGALDLIFLFGPVLDVLESVLR